MLRRVVSRPAPPLLYWRTLTPNCATLNFSVKKTEQTNTLLAQASTRLVSALCSQRASTGEAAIPALQILDEWSWVTGRCESYDDHVHHSKLAFAHVRTLLDHACRTLRRARGTPTPRMPRLSFR